MAAAPTAEVEEISSSFAELAETDLWVDLGMLVVGFVGSDFIQSTVDGMMPWNVPNEAYGLFVGGGSIYFGYRQPALGGALYAANEAGKRFGLHQSLGINGGN